MEQKAKPQQSYFQTTLFACRAQYVNIIIEACVFAMSLAIYVNHYSLDTDIYDNWNRFPIKQISERDECQPKEEIILQYRFPYTSVGCYCGDIDNFDSSVLQDDNCSISELSQDIPCIEIEPVGGKQFYRWKSSKYFCGVRSNSPYKDVFENSDENGLKCNIDDSCPDYIKKAVSKSIYELTINYENGNCYDKGKQNTENYPLLQKAYECITYDNKLFGLDTNNQDDVFKQNDFQNELKTLIGYAKYENAPNFQLFASQFTIYNCSLPRIDIVSWRDNQIQISSLVVLIFSGLLLGIGAICFAGVISNLNKQGVLKRKQYLVNKKFYIPTCSNIFLYFITFVSIIVQIAFVGSLIMKLQDFIDNQCSSWSSLQDLEKLKDFAKYQLIGYSIAALLFTILGQSLEIFQLIHFTKKPLPKIGTPKFRNATTHANKFSIVEIPDDKSEKNILQVEVLNTTSKNEILKKYQN